MLSSPGLRSGANKGQARAIAVMTHNPNVLDLYRRLSVVRQFEERCLELSHAGVIKGSIHLCLGQEAIPVGACAALEPADRVIATYRGHGWAIARGVPLEPLLGEICQRADGLNGGRCGSPLLSAPEYGFFGENSIVRGRLAAAPRRRDGRSVSAARPGRRRVGR